MTTFNQAVNTSNPALQGRNAAFRTPQSQVVARAGQLGELASTQGQGLSGQAAGGTAASSTAPGVGPQGSVAPGGQPDMQAPGAFNPMAQLAQAQFGGQPQGGPVNMPGVDPEELQNEFGQEQNAGAFGQGTLGAQLGGQLNAHPGATRQSNWGGGIPGRPGSPGNSFAGRGTRGAFGGR